MPQLHYNKKKEDEEAQVRGKTAQLKDPKTLPFISLRVQFPYVASSCTPYTELNVFFHSVNTTGAVNNPCLQY